MQRYLEPGVDLVLTLGIIFLLPLMAARLGQQSIANLILVSAAVLALPLGLLLLRHVKPAVPSWVDLVKMPAGKWSGLLWGYTILLSWHGVQLLIAYSGLGAVLLNRAGLTSSGMFPIEKAFEAAITTKSHFATVILLVAIMGSVPLFMLMRYHPKRMRLPNSSEGLVLRGLGLLSVNFALLVFAAVARASTFFDGSLSDNPDSLFRSSFFWLAVLPLSLLFPLAVFILYSLPLHDYTRVYNLFWLRSVTYALNVLVAAFIVVW